MDSIKPYNENVTMPDERFRAKCFLSKDFEHVLAVHPHWHQEIELLFVLEGRAVQQVNDHFFTVEPGDMILIGKNQLHSTYSHQCSRCEILVIMFDSNRLLGGGEAPNKSEAAEIFENRVRFVNPIKPDSKYGELLRGIFFEIREELDKQEIGFQSIVKSLLYRMTGTLIRSELFRIDAGDVKSQQLIRQVLEKTFRLIDENYFEEISLKEAAAASNLSVPHFCRLFRKATGMTFHAYLGFYRINRAEKLMGTNRTCMSIAMECGFGSVSSFIRSFKKYKKCTPTEYCGKFDSTVSHV